jgi:hypothetical protein
MSLQMALEIKTAKMITNGYFYRVHHENCATVYKPKGHIWAFEAPSSVVGSISMESISRHLDPLQTTPTPFISVYDNEGKVLRPKPTSSKVNILGDAYKRAYQLFLSGRPRYRHITITKIYARGLAVEYRDSGRFSIWNHPALPTREFGLGWLQLEEVVPQQMKLVGTNMRTDIKGEWLTCNGIHWWQVEAVYPIIHGAVFFEANKWSSLTRLVQGHRQWCALPVGFDSSKHWDFENMNWIDQTIVRNKGKSPVRCEPRKEHVLTTEMEKASNSLLKARTAMEILVRNSINEDSKTVLTLVRMLTTWCDSAVEVTRALSSVSASLNDGVFGNGVSSATARKMETPVQNAPVRNAPVRNAPVRNAPVQNAPLQNAPVQNTFPGPSGPRPLSQTLS